MDEITLAPPERWRAWSTDYNRLVPLPRRPLTDRQLAVLRWIADGCPDGVWSDHSHKLSVGALEVRNLASARRWYGRWSAVLQPDGRYYLDHDDLDRLCGYHDDDFLLGIWTPTSAQSFAAQTGII